MIDEKRDESVELEQAGGGIARTPLRLQPLAWLSLLLGIALVVLLVVLALLLNPRALVTEGGAPVGGIEPILLIEGPGRGEAPAFNRPLDVAFGINDRIYVVDSDNNRIAVFSRQGRFLFEFGGFGITKPSPGFEATWEEGLLNFPLGIDIDDDGTVYIADFRNDQIQVFDAEGEFIRRFPDPATRVGAGASGQDGTGIAVTSLAVHDGHVYATDSYQVVVFTTEGEFVRQFGRPGVGPGEFDRPNGIDVTEDGMVVVADSNNSRIQMFTSDGELEWVTGDKRRVTALGASVEDPDAVFGLPRGVTVLDDGTIAVVDSFEYDIVLLAPDGRILGRHGQRGVQPGELNLPNGISSSGDLLVVADKENNRIQVLRLAR
ncbi:MAG: 6-bladed beta-propeller [Clostridiales bacterium]|nr:6-bladed beta-propeller [Clostridiales bacterium]